MSLKTQTSAVAPQGRTGGCGGGCGGSCGGGCSGCGGSSPSVGSAAGSAFVRPNFFGGMLLTEDDLQAVTEYVVGKRRLTNRSVFGAGVVCGLDVSCDACETGSVVVGPGYAIDCCGNDVVVDCPTPVDVVALVRELRQRGGPDCGEPCGDRPCDDYVLNVRYTETPTDPVAPYADEACAVGDCEFSRIREGHRFELSCDPPEPEPDLVDILRACLDVDDDRVKEDAAVMARVVRIGLSQQQGSLPAETPPEVPLKRELDDVERAAVGWEQRLEVVSRGVSALHRDAAEHAGNGPAIRMTGTQRTMLRSRIPELARELLASEAFLARPADERREIAPLLEFAAAQPAVAGAAWAEAPPSIRLPGSTGGVPTEEAYVRDAARLKSRVLRELADSGRAGCREYRAVSALKLATLDETSPREVRVLGRTFVSVLVRCVCSAANPRCPSCTDARIPLARVRVDGCDVVSVCDLERQWVHSPRALAYWFPVVETLRRLLERRCCPDGCDERSVESRPAKVREREVEILREQATSSLRMVRPPEDVPVIRQVLEALGDEFEEPRRAVSAAPEPPGTAARIDALEQQLAELRSQLAARLRSGTGDPAEDSK